jgi:hypothetical protein
MTQCRQRGIVAIINNSRVILQNGHMGNLAEARVIGFYGMYDTC